jgi:hypothetical protein
MFPMNASGAVSSWCASRVNSLRRFLANRQQPDPRR